MDAIFRAKLAALIVEHYAGAVKGDQDQAEELVRDVANVLASVFGGTAGVHVEPGRPLPAKIG
jgi:hypothetical protein